MHSAMLNKHDLTHAARCMFYLAIILFSLEYSSFVYVNDLSERNAFLKSRRGESNFISAIRSIIDADMARQQQVHGIFKDFYVIQNRFSCSAHQ